MRDVIHETTGTVQYQDIAPVVEYGGGALVLAAAGYVALKAYGRSKLPKRHVPEKFRMPPASADEPVVPTPESVDPVDSQPSEPDFVIVEESVRDAPEPYCDAEPEPKQSSSESRQANRETALYLHSFFGISSDTLDQDAERISEITSLAGRNDPANFPDEIHEQTAKVIGKISDLVTSSPGKKIVLFNTKFKSQPSGLSVAIALERIGFATPPVQDQYNNNAGIDDNDENFIVTQAELSGKNRLKVSYRSDGQDTAVTLELKDTEYRPKSKADDYQPVRPQAEGKRARPRGHSIHSGSFEFGVGGINTGRKRGPMPPGGH